jgi:hypothetical protein
MHCIALLNITRLKVVHDNGNRSGVDTEGCWVGIQPGLGSSLNGADGRRSAVAVQPAVFERHVRRIVRKLSVPARGRTRVVHTRQLNEREQGGRIGRTQLSSGSPAEIFPAPCPLLAASTYMRRFMRLSEVPHVGPPWPWLVHCNGPGGSMAVPTPAVYPNQHRHTMHTFKQRQPPPPLHQQSTITPPARLHELIRAEVTVTATATAIPLRLGHDDGLAEKGPDSRHGGVGPRPSSCRAPHQNRILCTQSGCRHSRSRTTGHHTACQHPAHTDHANHHGVRGSARRPPYPPHSPHRNGTVHDTNSSVLRSRWGFDEGGGRE